MLLVAFVLVCAASGSTEIGTIIEFVDDAVIVAMEDGKSVIRIEDYHTYIPTGEQWLLNDKVQIKNSRILNKLSIHRLKE